MSMTLSGTERTFSVDHGTWSQVLVTAHENGWKPMGTLSPIFDQDSLDWSGNYSSNDSQLVGEEDAANLADALERALDDAADDEKPFLQDMIAFCREGGFRLF